MADQLRSEDIYDAMLDEDVFANLPARMAEAYGARSCVLWWSNGPAAQVMAHNGYYPDAEMLNYAQNYTADDLWSIEGTRPQYVNRVMNCDELVSPTEYERSVFYNEWIRGMGDDTFHCLGIAVKTDWGYGFVGLHRGRTQGSFDENNTQAMERDIVHLRRMLTMRGSVSAGRQRAQDAEAVLDCVGDALITLTREGRIVHANAAAEAILRRSDGLCVARGTLAARAQTADAALRRAIAAATARSQSSASAVPVPRSGGGQYDLTVSALRTGSAPGLVLIALRDPDRQDPSLERRLAALYGLSKAEAQIAARLADGASPSEIAGVRGVSVETVRKQLKSLSDKLSCRRQSEIVAVVKALPLMGGR